MDEYLTDGALSEETLRGLIAGRRIFPCYFGSALRLSGVEELIAGLERWIQPAAWPASFGAKVYKISRDTQGARLTHLQGHRRRAAGPGSAHRLPSRRQ